MKPYCDRPHCLGQFTHDHASESPERPFPGPESDAEPIPTRDTPPNGSEAPERSDEPKRETLKEREWSELAGKLQTAEATVGALRRRRVEILERWHSEGMSYEQIAAVTKLTRQRVGQLLKR